MKTTAAMGTIRESSAEELLGRVKRLEEELFQHRLKRYTNQLENTNVIREARREIARCKTILSSRSQGTDPQRAKAEVKE
jgi:large subunit ribosomal protein L29